MIKIINDSSKDNKISLDDGLFFAKSVFETILVKDKPIFLKQHINRLHKSIKKLDIKKNVTFLEVKKYIEDYSIKNCILKIVVTDKNIIFTTREIKYTKDDYMNGISLSISNVKRNSTSLITYLKTTAYIENILEKEKAVKNGFNDMLFLNENSEIAECTSSNIFWIKDEKIYTSDIECGILPGIVRDWILTNFTVNLGFYKLQNLLEADEVFITNSVLGIMRVNKIENKIFKCNKITNKIMIKYLDIVEVI